MLRYAFLGPLSLLAACGGGGGGTTPPPANQPPSFTSPATVSVVENNANAYQATATDPDGNPLTFSITGGADAARFTITAAGQLRFVAAPNFDLPADADGNNIYLVEISVGDSQTSRALSLQVTVTNDREGIAVRRVATGFNQPVFVAAIPGDTRVFVLEKAGDIYLLDPATGGRSLFLRASERLNPGHAGIFDNISTDGERGLLGMAVSPDYQATRRFTLFVTNADGDIEIRLCRRTPGVQSAQGRDCQVLFAIEHSQFNNHNGGWMGYGPDGLLYIATGDGNVPANAQNTSSLLGKILRITIVNDPFAGTSPTYFLPAPGNPFAGGAAGDPLVYAYGLRNPFRASFSGDALVIGDVGQDTAEEIDILRTTTPGLNFGWPFREGARPFSGTAPAGLTEPVSEYLHGSGPRQGASIIGGYVYRGSAVSLRGSYVFADFVSRNFWSVPASQLVQGQLLASSQYERRNEDFAPDAGTLDQPASFGEDAAGNLYIVDYDGDIFLVGGS